MRGFMDNLITTLKSYIEPYLDEPVYLDKERLKPGYEFNEAIAKAICRSVCMIMIYVPKYFSQKHPYCHREYLAMKRLEEQRQKFIGPERRLIIPIVFRGQLPAQIKASIQGCDFSRYSTVNTDISGNPEYVAVIEQIAQYIRELYDEFARKSRQLGEDPCDDCLIFELPSQQEVVEAPQQPFPGRRQG